VSPKTPPPPLLPPRLAWEEPPPDGWASSLPGAARELLLFIVCIALGLLVSRIVHTVRALHADELHGASYAGFIGLWLLACLLSAALAVYLWQRLGGVSVVGAMLTDYGRLARMGGRPPVWLDAPPPDGLRIAHLTDLHINEAEGTRLVEHPLPGGNAVLDRLLAHPAVAEAELVLITGDITDRGTAVSWRHFRDALEERGLADRAILVPGNHDLAFVEAVQRHQVWRLDRFGIVQLANLLKFGEAFADTAGGKRGIVCVDGEERPFADAWADAERAVRPLVAALPTMPVPPLTLRRWRSQRGAFADYVERIEKARATLMELFPVAVPLDEHDAVVFVLNSVSRVSRHPALNGIGRIGRAQFRRLYRLAAKRTQRCKLVAVHHHLVRRGEEQSARFVSRLFAKFTVLGDAPPLVRFCQKQGVRAVLNGHRHLSYQLRLPNGTVLLAAPSSTLGDQLARDFRPQLERYDIAPAADVYTVGIYHNCVRLPREADVEARSAHAAD
jgi:3',5'-cyclic AMP phosphodiesterase CpdA